MKRVFGLILVGLGVALVVIAFLFRFWVGPSAAQTPLNTYVETKGSGVIIKQLDISKFVAGDPNPYYPLNLPATSTRYTKGDLVAEEQDPAKSQNLAVFDTFSRTNTEDGRLVSASDARYAFGRQDSQLQNCCGAREGTDSEVNFVGNVPLKFPFFTQQQTYPVWDGQILTSVPAEFQGEETVGGLNVYKFHYFVPPTLMPNQTQKVPAKALGQTGGDVEVNPYYTNDLTFLIEPLTGQVVSTGIKAKVTFRANDGEKDVATFLEQEFPIPGNITPEDVSSISATASQLKLVMYTVPLISLIVGVVFLIVGFILLRLDRRRDDDDLTDLSKPAGTPPPPVNV